MASYHYWQHFLALEADFAGTARYVEFSQQNFNTYSIEYVKLLLAIGSEVDVLLKIICKNIDSTAKRGNIDDYRNCMTKHTEIASEEVLMQRYDLAFKPWQDWSASTNPKWWQSYNDVKHQRDMHFPKANLENCANAISGLFAAVLYCYKAENSAAELQPYPVLLGREKEPGYIRPKGGQRGQIYLTAKGDRFI